MLRKMTRTATIASVLLMAYVTLMAMPVQAQTNLQKSVAIPLPTGVTPDVSYNTIAHMSFRPNPVGFGQPLLVNMWLQPPIHVSTMPFRIHGDIHKARRNHGSVGPMDSYQGDTTAWFEYVVDQVGTWKIKFNFPGDYFPAGNYTVWWRYYAVRCSTLLYQSTISPAQMAHTISL